MMNVLSDRIPEEIHVICLADGTKMRGVLSLLEFRTLRRNPFRVISRPTSVAGVAVVKISDVVRSIEADIRAFPQDYGSATDITGEIAVCCMTEEMLRAAIEAYRAMDAHFQYPDGYLQGLTQALERLRRTYQGMPLTVRVSGHVGEGAELVITAPAKSAAA